MFSVQGAILSPFAGQVCPALWTGLSPFGTAKRDNLVPLPAAFGGPLQGCFARAVARGFPLVGPALHGHVTRRLDLVQRPLDRFGVLADGRADGLERRAALAGFMIGMGQRQVERHAQGVVVQLVVGDHLQKILQLDLAEGQKLRHRPLPRLRSRARSGIHSEQTFRFGR